MPRGKCRHCGCTDDDACRYLHPFEFMSDQLVCCSWVDKEHTLCSNPECQQKEMEGK